MKVEISDQVFDFVMSQAPVPRKGLRSALKGLSKEEGDIKPLEKELDRCLRLRYRGYRIIFRYEIVNKKRKILCDFAERRGLVYEIFSKNIRDILSGS